MPVQTYKQALRGLFASGTSPSRYSVKTTEKVGRKTRIESRFIGVMSSIPQRGINRKTR